MTLQKKQVTIKMKTEQSWETQTCELLKLLINAITL